MFLSWERDTRRYQEWFRRLKGERQIFHEILVYNKTIFRRNDCRGDTSFVSSCVEYSSSDFIDLTQKFWFVVLWYELLTSSEYQTFHLILQIKLAKVTCACSKMIIYRMVIVEGRCTNLQLLISYIYNHSLTQKYSEFWLVRYNGLVWSDIAVPFVSPSYTHDPWFLLTVCVELRLIVSHLKLQCKTSNSNLHTNCWSSLESRRKYLQTLFLFN